MPKENNILLLLQKVFLTVLNFPPAHASPRLSERKGYGREVVHGVFCLTGFGLTGLVYRLSQNHGIRSIPNLQIKTIQPVKVNYHPSAMNRPHILRFLLKYANRKV